MKRVMIYGDSITWGRRALVSDRFDENTRFTKVAQKALGPDYEIIEEGLRARTLSGENGHYRNRDGLQQFGPIFGSQVPLDLVVIFLGTNDLNDRSTKTPQEIAEALDDYFTQITAWCKELDTAEPKVMIVSPPHIREEGFKEDSIFVGGGDKSKQLAPLYEAVAQKQGVAFFDSAKVVNAGLDDGVHLDADANIELGYKLAEAITQVLDQESQAK